MKLSCFLIPGILAAVTIWSCSKSNNGKPQLSIESINNPIQIGQDLDARLKFSKGGGLSGGTLLVVRTRVNQKAPTNTVGKDTNTYIIPEFAAEKGELEFRQPYQGFLHFDDDANDTLVFHFAVISKDGKTSSDTVASSKIVSLSL